MLFLFFKESGSVQRIAHRLSLKQTKVIDEISHVLVARINVHRCNADTTSTRHNSVQIPLFFSICQGCTVWRAFFLGRHFLPCQRSPSSSCGDAWKRLGQHVYITLFVNLRIAYAFNNTIKSLQFPGRSVCALSCPRLKEQGAHTRGLHCTKPTKQPQPLPFPPLHQASRRRPRRERLRKRGRRPQRRHEGGMCDPYLPLVPLARS